MPTTDSSNNNIPASVPPPPPPPPPGWNNTYKHNDKDGKSPSVTAEKSSSGTQLKRGLSEISNPNFLEELKNNSKFKEANNANGETADKGSNIRQSEKNRSSTPKPVFPRVLSPQQDNGSSNKPFSNSEDSKRTKTIPDLSNSYNLSSELKENNKPLEAQNTLEERCEINTGQGVPQKPMTEQHSGVQFDKDKPGEMKCESKNQKSSLAEQKKATGLKYSIAILLLCTSGAVAGVCTYFMISAVLSGVAVPVFFAVIASVSALVMLSSAAYLINSCVFALNSEKKIGPNRKQSQEAESFGHSNTPIPSLEISGTLSAPPPPPPPPVKSNDLSTAQRVIRKNSPSDANQKDVQQKQSGTPVDALSNLFSEISKGTTLKKVPDKQKHYLPEDGKQESDVQLRNKGVHQVRKVESQKTDKEPNNSESMQQMDSFTIAIQKQRERSGFQNAQLDSLDEQENSLFSLEEESWIEQKKMSNQKDNNYVHFPNESTVFRNMISVTNPLLDSPIDNLSSNSGNVPDYEDWETQPQSIPYGNRDKTLQDIRQEKKERGVSPSATKGSGADQVSNEVQNSSIVSFEEKRLRISKV
ncbi:hypothetical protein wNo_00160 [Wolbachia endosymbiont of Drosophila simulans wNo]|uniref:hypothetical protein n=1 Tax=Wolbachia endosymbiont of Drosophila simulans TaxID=77038 RepID=UPI0002D25521|nr:hypothetical protein [Wolbachia endosymbiont of Drosophila simulans]AGJ98477.1 hypothetical protein wNo_00160 [Wolbachia endosymbiont of Drosophila simulans wNo]